jgi:endonuclease/exonuclease/phosphatase family metal-dependent hydrolase
MRVLSYNIHKGIGGRDRRYRLERIRAVIHEANPDFVCLQEVDQNVARSRFDDQPRRLAQELELPFALYQLNVVVPPGGYGNLLLSRWPFETAAQISLTLRRCKPRGAQWGVIRTPHGLLRLVNLHLGLREREREWQVRRLLEHHDFHSRHQLPTLIIGDTNDWRNTLADGPFAVHSYRHLTHEPRRYRSFPAWLPMGALDKAYANSRITQTHSQLIRTQRTQAASDHLPLQVDFSLDTVRG